ncbi:MAG: methylmalonyl-CoA mutase [Deltaproteobacteria bacterium]|nr:MAG: methylmalonyl-CoA mutase [Deltaproteobacteria bacterium]
MSSRPEGAPMPTSTGPMQVDLATWRRLVERDLRGRDFESVLVRRDVDGLETQPLYTEDDVAGLAPAGLPGHAPWTRGRRPRGRWRIVQQVLEPELAAARDQVRDELEHGADGVLLSLDIAGRGYAGVRTPLAASLRQLLGGVERRGALLAFDAGAHFLSLAGAIAATGVAAGCTVHLGADPVGVLAATGWLPGGSRAMGWLGDVAVWCHDRLPGGRAVAVDTSPYHLAGASDTDDLAIALATGVTCLRALTDAGLSIDESLDQIVFRVPVDPMMLGGIARIRALRLCWGRIAAASGARPSSGGAWVHAVPARRVLTAVDPWGNLLRGTAMCFAGACGGADAVTVAPFDGARGLSSDAGRRLARNTQLVLAWESHLDRTLDPAGGSAFIEARTDQLCRRAWDRFQQIEAAGGIIPALESGRVQDWIDQAAAERARRVATRRWPITGVSEFPNLDEPRLEERAAPPPPPAPQAPELGLPTLPDPGAGVLTTAIANRLADPGAPVPLATFTELAELPAAAVSAEALEQRPLARGFEELRARSDALLALTGARPSAWLAAIGPLADFQARATFATHLLAAGGVASRVGRGGEDPAAIAEEWREHGAAALVVLCGSDAGYRERGAEVVAALRRAGAGCIWLAGRADPPGAPPHTLPADLVDGQIHQGCDVLEALHRAWSVLADGGR